MIWFAVVWVICFWVDVFLYLLIYCLWVLGLLELKFIVTFVGL